MKTFYTKYLMVVLLFLFLFLIHTQADTELHVTVMVPRILENQRGALNVTVDYVQQEWVGTLRLELLGNDSPPIFYYSDLTGNAITGSVAQPPRPVYGLIQIPLSPRPAGMYDFQLIITYRPNVNEAFYDTLPTDTVYNDGMISVGWVRQTSAITLNASQLPEVIRGYFSTDGLLHREVVYEGQQGDILDIGGMDFIIDIPPGPYQPGVPYLVTLKMDSSSGGFWKNHYMEAEPQSINGHSNSSINVYFDQNVITIGDTPRLIVNGQTLAQVYVVGLLELSSLLAGDAGLSANLLTFAFDQLKDGVQDLIVERVASDVAGLIFTPRAEPQFVTVDSLDAINATNPSALSIVFGEQNYDELGNLSEVDDFELQFEVTFKTAGQHKLVLAPNILGNVLVYKTDWITLPFETIYEYRDMIVVEFDVVNQLVNEATLTSDGIKLFQAGSRIGDLTFIPASGGDVLAFFDQDTAYVLGLDSRKIDWTVDIHRGTREYVYSGDSIARDVPYTIGLSDTIYVAGLPPLGGSPPPSIRVWSPEYEMYSEFDGFYGVDQLEMHPTGTTVLVVDSGALYVVSASSGKRINTIVDPNDSLFVAHAMFSADGKEIIFQSYDGQPYIVFDNEIIPLPFMFGETRYTATAYSELGMFAEAHQNGMITIEDISGIPPLVIQGPLNITDITFNMDSSRLAAATESGEIWVWQLANGSDAIVQEPSADIGTPIIPVDQPLIPTYKLRQSGTAGPYLISPIPDQIRSCHDIQIGEPFLFTLKTGLFATDMNHENMTELNPADFAEYRDYDPSYEYPTYLIVSLQDLQTYCPNVTIQPSSPFAEPLPVETLVPQSVDHLMQAESIWKDIAFNDMQSPNMATYRKTVTASKTYRMQLFWCATSRELLQQGLDTMDVRFEINAVAVPEANVIAYDSPSGEWECHIWGILLDNWKSSETLTLDVFYQLHQDYFDGVATYRQGEYVHRMIVTVN